MTIGGMFCHARNDEKCCHIEVSQETEISKKDFALLALLTYLSASEISFIQCELSYLRAFNPEVSQKSTHPLYPPPQRRGIKKQTPIVLREEELAKLPLAKEGGNLKKHKTYLSYLSVSEISQKKK